MISERSRQPGPFGRRLLAVVLLIAACVASAPSSATAAAPDGASRLVALQPARLADTRLPDCTCSAIDASTIRVTVAGRAAVPGDAIAAALTITVTGARQAGYATVWPSGTPRQETSTLNWASGETRANGAIVPIGAGGSVDVYVDGSYDAADLIVDVTGAFVPVVGGSSEGRFQALPPDRLVDTRFGAPVAAGSTTRVPLPMAVPPDAMALAVNVTAVDSTGFGYLTAHAAGSDLPATSTVNTDAPGQTRASTAIIPVSPGGIDVFSSMATHFIVDVVGWFTGASAPPADEGLFVPWIPQRLFDTRQSSRPAARNYVVELHGGSPAAETTITTVLTQASALVTNATSTGQRREGYVTAFPARTSQPETSSLNWRKGETVANLTITRLSTAGVAYYSSATTELIVDLTGYFTGPRTPAILDAPTVSPERAVQEPQVAALVESALPAEVWDALVHVEMAYLENPTCSGRVGSANSRSVFLARGFFTVCAQTDVPRGAAAHEVGHVLSTNWLLDQEGDPQERSDRLFALEPSALECIAEAIGRELFRMAGLGPYPRGYGGFFDACARQGEPLAQEIIADVLQWPVGMNPFANY